MTVGLGPRKFQRVLAGKKVSMSTLCSNEIFAAKPGHRDFHSSKWPTMECS